MQSQLLSSVLKLLSLKMFVLHFMCVLGGCVLFVCLDSLKNILA